MLIGISGKAQSGKDTVAKIIRNYSSRNWEFKKFADPLKDMTCLLIGCTREQLEDIDFKNTSLGIDWVRYKEDFLGKVYNTEKEAQEAISMNYAIQELTPRLLMQLLGTECGRNLIHPNIWVNAVMRNYRFSPSINWIITDVRFPNEAKAVIDRGGLLFRIERPGIPLLDHASETALDQYDDWNEVIYNDSSLIELEEKIQKLVKKYSI
jgi:hypothetical protein